MARLAVIIRIQSIALVIYGVTFTFLPDFTTDTLFGWEGVDLTWVRSSGIAFLILGWAAWLVASRLEGRLDLVWPLVILPGGYLVAFLAERATDVYQGTDSFWWTNLVVVAFFFVALLWARLTVGES